jgi:DNA-binding NtrC family response regulator
MQKQMRVLLVDDEHVFLLLLKGFLEQQDLIVDIAETYEEAMSMIDSAHYDILVSDIRLTGVLGEEGLAILQYVKQNIPVTKVIIITGYDNAAIMNKALKLGADMYLEKPVSANFLLRAIENMGLEYSNTNNIYKD